MIHDVNERSDEKLDMPMSHRFSDRLTMDIDVYRTEWDIYLIEDE